MSHWSRFTRARAAVGAVVVVAVLGVGVAVASMPGSAAGPTARAASPVTAVAAERDGGPLHQGPSTILRVRVRKGLYAVNAKVVLRTQNTTGTGCKLVIGTATIDQSEETHPDFFTSRTSTHALQFAGRLGGVLSINCSAGTFSAEMARITAIRLTSLRKR
jgi:hypothetical protein